MKCLDFEDLKESTEGFSPIVTEEGKIALAGSDFETCPPILGYNETKPLDDSQVLMRFKETGDPLLVTKSFGKGKTLAYTSDPAPHWGCNFVYWSEYNKFWVKCVELLLD